MMDRVKETLGHVCSPASSVQLECRVWKGKRQNTRLDQEEL